MPSATSAPCSGARKASGMPTGPRSPREKHQLQRRSPPNGRESGFASPPPGRKEARPDSFGEFGRACSVKCGTPDRYPDVMRLLLTNDDGVDAAGLQALLGA